MPSLHDSDRKQHSSLRPLALCILALVAAGLCSAAAVAATDPDWFGTVPANISQSDTGETLHPAIAVGSSGLTVAAWSDPPAEGSSSDVYLTRSDDAGGRWSAPAPLSPVPTSTQQLPDALITAEDQIFVAWAEKHSDDTPTTFTVHEGQPGSTPRLIPVPEGDAPSRWTTGPRLAAGPDRLHVVFNAGTQASSHIHYSSRPLTETTWPTATRIYTSTGGNPAWFPALAVSADGTDLHVVWEEKPFGAARSVQYLHGTFQESSLEWASAPLKLSSDVNSVKPDLALSSRGDVHVVWAEADSEQDPYYVAYRRYDAGEESWTAARRIDPRPVGVNQISPNESAPRLALWERGHRVRLCVAWHGFRIDEEEEAESDAEDVLLSCSHDSGDTWQPPRRMSAFPEGQTESDEPSVRPSIAFDAAGILHAVWQQRIEADDDEWSYQIYYAREMNRIFLPLVLRNG